MWPEFDVSPTNWRQPIRTIRMFFAMPDRNSAWLPATGRKLPYWKPARWRCPPGWAAAGRRTQAPWRPWSAWARRSSGHGRAPKLERRHQGRLTPQAPLSHLAISKRWRARGSAAVSRQDAPVSDGVNRLSSWPSPGLAWRQRLRHLRWERLRRRTARHG
jgi:hypothetical protein